MGLDLDTRRIKTISGLYNIVPDYAGKGHGIKDASYKWEHAASKTGLDKKSVHALFKYYQEHPFLAGAYDSAARAFGGDHKRIATHGPSKTGNPSNPYARQDDYSKVRYGLTNFFNEKTRKLDPFANDRISAVKRKQANFRTWKDEATGLNLGSYETYSLKKNLGTLKGRVSTGVTTVRTGPYGRQTKQVHRYKNVTAKYGSKYYNQLWAQQNNKFQQDLKHTYSRKVSNAGGNAFAASPQGRMSGKFNNPYQPQYERVGMTDSMLKGRGLHAVNSKNLKNWKGKYDTTGKRGVVLNNAFVEEDVFNKMTPEQRHFYGMTWAQATKQDKGLDAATQVISSAHQYRRGRASKKTGLGAVVKSVAPLALGAGVGLATGGLGLGAVAQAAVSGAASSAIQGGNLGDILKGGALGALGGGLGDKFGKAGQIAAGAGKTALEGGDLGQILAGGITGGYGAEKGITGLAANTSAALLEGSGLAGALNAAIEGGQLEDILGEQLKSGGNMSIIGDLWNKVKGIGSTALGHLGGLGDLLGKGYNALGGTKGIIGGLGDILAGKGVAGELAKGAAGYYSNREAARTQEKANDQAIALADPLASYRPGYAGQLNQLMKNPALALQLDPGANFRFEQGERALRRKLAASGGRFSGESLLAAQEYGQNFATQEYGAAFDRLHTLATGNTAAAQIQQGAGQNQADSKIAQYDIITQGGSTIGGVLANILKGDTRPPPLLRGSNSNINS